jgi:hypothetical protein
VSSRGAAWDLAFHTVALAMVDLDFAKHQLDLMLQEVYLHPNGQIPAAVASIMAQSRSRQPSP